MADDTGTPNDDGTQDSGQQDSGKDGGFKPITSQDELNAALKDRLARERAKFADYNDLKKKAEQFDAAQDAAKTEAEKTADRIAALEREVTEAKSAALRSRIQAKFAIADEDADLFLTATDEDTLTKQAQRLAERAEDRKKNGNVVPREGRTPASGDSKDSSERQFARNLFASGD